MLVDELGVTVPPEQHAEIVKPGDHALQFHTVDEEYRQRDFVLSDVVEKRILQILRAFARHILEPREPIATQKAAIMLLLLSAAPKSFPECHSGRVFREREIRT
ncbi:hypothetical protein FHS81_000703 [Pseudochelatococcus contaminans]|uniref:Uncharacterized protein n=1 Tax=Pseudochelatococcus contaminans TaxID=1538103 RepID=A0A7W5Z288_9HYPH|nr:hypothetical protein [Pseudochelatococcus contaminans]